MKNNNNNNNKKIKSKNNIMQEVVVRCSAKKFPKMTQKLQKNIVLKSLPNTVKDLHDVRLATLLNRNPRIDVLKPAVL